MEVGVGLVCVCVCSFGGMATGPKSEIQRAKKWRLGKNATFEGYNTILSPVYMGLIVFLRYTLGIFVS